MSRPLLVSMFFLFAVFLLFCGRVRIAPPDLAFYYAYPQSMLNDGDLQFHNEYSTFPFAIHELYRTDAGYTANDWPLGTGLCWLPFLFLAKILCWISGIAYDHGTSWFAQWVVTLGATLLYGFGTLWLTWKWCLLEGLPKPAVGLALALHGVGSTLTYHLYVNSADSHTPSAFFAVWLIYTWRRTDAGDVSVRYALMGMIAGMGAMIRPHNALFLLIPLLHDAVLQAKKRSFHRYPRSVVILLLMFCITLSPQWIVWKTVYGSWFALPRAGDMLWMQPRLMDMLFSHYHGMISWSPVLAFGLLGLLLSRRGWLFSLPVLLQLYLVSCHIAWWAGGSFGNRRMVGCIPLLVFGLAELLDAIPKLWLKVVLCLCVLWTMVLMLAEIGGALPLDRPLYWIEIFDAVTRGFLPGLQFHVSLPQWQEHTVQRLIGWFCVTGLLTGAGWVVSQWKWTAMRCATVSGGLVLLLVVLTGVSALRSRPLPEKIAAAYKPYDRFNWEVYYEEGFFDLSGGRPEAAMQKYLAAFVIEPRHPQPTRYLALILKTRNHDVLAYHYARTAMVTGYRSDTFLDFFEQQITLMILWNRFPAAVLHQERGIVRTIRGNFDGAEYDFQRAIELNPESESSKANLERVKQWRQGIQVPMEWG